MLMIMQLAYDRYGRYVNHLRISVTDRCNLKCIHCHREVTTSSFNAEKSEMTPDEIATIVEVAASFGVTAVKITGGEPLVRSDIVEIVEKITDVREIKDVSMVTNGILLEKYASQLKKAGLNRVNVSLHAITPSVFKYITGTTVFSSENVKRGIIQALKVGLKPVKINYVLFKKINYNELTKIIDFAKEYNLILQVIELVNLNLPPKFYKENHMNLQPLEDELKSNADWYEERSMQKRVRIGIGKLVVEFVRPVHNTQFCANCHKLRVTSNGFLKPCLMRNDNLVDILTAIRSKKSFEELQKIYLKAISLREPFFRDKHTLPRTIKPTVVVI